MKKYTQEEIDEVLILHAIWLNGDAGGVMANLRDANLEKADLRRADLRWADLRRADLRWADLQGASLRGADLRWADLRGANLRWADLQGADLRWADLQGANLDFSCWPLSCGSKDVKLDNRQQAQLLGHIIDVCKNVKFTEEQIDFVYKNWERADEFLGNRKEMEK